MADQDRTFSPTEVEANRAAQQGLGVGQRELDAQRDPGEPAPVEEELAAEVEDDEALSAEDRRLLKVESGLGQGSKTRQHQKDAISRRV
jgi:hypothetical protein